MKSLKSTFKFLNPRERFFVLVAVIIRVMLVAFDLAGIFLVGVVVSLISGTVISSTSPLSVILVWLNDHGYQDGYVVLAAVAVVFFIAKGLLSVVLSYLTATYVARIEAAKASQVYEGLVRAPLAKVEKFTSQDALHGLTTSMNSAFASSINIGAAMVGEIALLIGVSSYLAYVNFWLFLGVALFFGFVGFLMQATIGRGSGSAAVKAHSGQLETHGSILNTLNNFRQVAASTSLVAFAKQFRSTRSATAHQNAVYATFTTLPRYITEISVMIGVGILVLQRSGGGGGVSAATIAVFLAGIFRIVASMLPLQAGLSALKRVTPEAELAFSLLSEFGQIKDSEPAQNYSAGAKAIDVKNLTFRYGPDSKTVLKDVTFSVPAGAYVAVTGKSGGGKSTLADLILGLRHPDDGALLIGGTTPASVRAARRGAIGYVPQNTHLIPGTVVENILLEVRPASVDRQLLSSVLKAAGLEDVVRQLPNGSETLIGAGGVDLSGGQTQRVGLARALYQKPDVLVLDEATSALDSETELLIHRALLSMRNKVTLIVIAHRPQTLSDADYYLNVEQGGATLSRAPKSD